MREKRQKNQLFKNEQGIANPLGKRLYTLKEAAQYLGRSDWSVRELIWEGVLPIVRPEGRRKIFLDIFALVEFVDRNKSMYQ